MNRCKRCSCDDFDYFERTVIYRNSMQMCTVNLEQRRNATQNTHTHSSDAPSSLLVPPTPPASTQRGREGERERERGRQSGIDSAVSRAAE
jgi:hypothetical protein